MKNLIYILACILLVSCDENEIMPSYQKKGTTTATVATIEVSNEEPESGETVTIALMYVNPTSDPVATVELKYKVGSASYSILQTFDENAGPKDEAINREISYVAPAAGTAVIFDMVITSQKEYPQIMRASIEVSDQFSGFTVRTGTKYSCEPYPITAARGIAWYHTSPGVHVSSFFWNMQICTAPK